jgi:Cdc6-like AAA superfamily ATPase
LQLFNEIWNEGRIPEKWNTAKIINIHKKGNKTECGNYRGISLLVTASKLYSAILKKKIQPIAETILNE